MLGTFTILEDKYAKEKYNKNHTRNALLKWIDQECFKRFLKTNSRAFDYLCNCREK